MPDGRMRTARCRHDHSAARTRARWALEDRKQQVRIQAEETLKTNLRTAAEVALEAASHGVVSETEANLLIESACKARAVTEGEWPIDDRRPVSPGAAERVAEASARLERALRIVREDAEDRSEMEQQALASQRRAEKKERRRARREQERKEGEAARVAMQQQQQQQEQRMSEAYARAEAMVEALQQEQLQMNEQSARVESPVCHDEQPLNLEGLRTTTSESRGNNRDDVHDAIQFLANTYNNQTVCDQVVVVMNPAEQLERAAARARQAAHELQQDDLLACQELEEALRESEDEYARVMEADAREERASNNSVSTYGECVVCLSERASHAVVPCGHMVTCASCAGEVRLEHCPLCRGTVAQLMRVFIA